MRRLFEVLFIMILTLSSCSEKHEEHPFKDITYDDLAKFRNADYIISPRRVNAVIDSIRTAERDTDYIDIMTNRYYAEHGSYLWIDHWGIDARTDTLISWLQEAQKGGIPSGKFRMDKIEKNLRQLQTGDYSGRQTISQTLGSLEYYLTKSYMRYCRGERFGYINPKKIYNRLEHQEADDENSPYKLLFDIPIDMIDEAFITQARQSQQNGQMQSFRESILPTSELYHILYKELQQPGLTTEKRKKAIVNLERSRWRQKQKKERKEVVVNLPSQQLQATNSKGDTLSMKVCIGSSAHKTPLLTSHITHLELNPYWIIPLSIVKREVASHAGDEEYFEQRRYEIIDKQNGEIVESGEHLTERMLASGRYTVRQKKGEGNSLGRMIFRLPNNSAIYLHDTNNPAAFRRTSRLLSHGCVRLERPFELAVFLLEEKDEEYIDRIRLALDLPPQTDQGKKWKEKDEGALSRCNFKEEIPVSLIYYTCYPTSGDRNVTYYTDVYHYDDAIWKHLNQN